MTAKEYLSQAHKLDVSIDRQIKDAEELRDKALSLRSPALHENCDPNRPTEAPFVKSLVNVWEKEREIDLEIDRLIDLKEEIRKVIETVPDANGRAVLSYRYIHGMKWEEIGRKLHVGRSTLHRWHRAALECVVVPEGAKAV